MERWVHFSGHAAETLWRLWKRAATVLKRGTILLLDSGLRTIQQSLRGTTHVSQTLVCKAIRGAKKRKGVYTKGRTNRTQTSLSIFLRSSEQVCYPLLKPHVNPCKTTPRTEGWDDARHQRGGSKGEQFGCVCRQHRHFPQTFFCFSLTFCLLHQFPGLHTLLGVGGGRWGLCEEEVGPLMEEHTACSGDGALEVGHQPRCVGPNQLQLPAVPVRRLLWPGKPVPADALLPLGNVLGGDVCQ